MEKNKFLEVCAKQKSYSENRLCPRCGKPLRPNDIENAISRYVDIYICSDCGTAEALDGFFGSPLPFEDWDIIKTSSL